MSMYKTKEGRLLYAVLSRAGMYDQSIYSPSQSVV
jgi:hypothetical protein